MIVIIIVFYIDGKRFDEAFSEMRLLCREDQPVTEESKIVFIFNLFKLVISIKTNNLNKVLSNPFKKSHTKGILKGFLVELLATINRIDSFIL